MGEDLEALHHEDDANCKFLVDLSLQCRDSRGLIAAKSMSYVDCAAIGLMPCLYIDGKGQKSTSSNPILERLSPLFLPKTF